MNTYIAQSQSYKNNLTMPMNIWSDNYILFKNIHMTALMCKQYI